MPKIKPANSSVIAGYELLKQTLELEEAKNQLAKIQDIQRKRRVPKKKKKEVKEVKTTKIDSMDMHRVPFNEFYERLNIKEDVTKIGLTQNEAEERNVEWVKKIFDYLDKNPTKKIAIIEIIIQLLS